MKKRAVVYIGETWIDSNLTFGKCWQSKCSHGILQTGNASRRIIVLCAGGEMGFLPNCNLVYQANTATGDYHGQMNANLYEKWAKEKLLPNLPQNAVVVIDNAPYHSAQMNKVPNSNSTKQIIMNWLSDNGIPHSSDIRKVELLELVKCKAPHNKTYRFDSMLADHGHTTLRLPHYHCNINAIEFVWAEVKRYVRNYNTSGDIEMTKLLQLTEGAINSVTVANRKKYCQHVQKLEKEYWDKDGVIEELCEPLVFSANNDESDSGSSTDDSE